MVAGGQVSAQEHGPQAVEQGLAHDHHVVAGIARAQAGQPVLRRGPAVGDGVDPGQPGVDEGAVLPRQGVVVGHGRHRLVGGRVEHVVQVDQTLQRHKRKKVEKKKKRKEKRKRE